MTTDRANGLVLTSLALSGALVVIREATDGDSDRVPPVRFMVGWVIAGAGLAALAQMAPQLAGGLAVLMLVTASLVYGGPAWKAISKAVT